MLEYRAEGLCRNASHLRREELDHCIAAGEVLQSTALAFDTNRRLRFELCGHHAYMPFEECLDTAPGETVKEIAVLTRVGRPTCFVVQGTTQDESGEAVYLLSRAAAQRACREQYLDQLENGSVIPCTVTHIENFGAFCDVGCGISALLPIDCLSVSRIASPADRVTVGQQLLCAIKNRDEQDRIVLTLRELLGTWSENAACFAAGETVVGIVRSVEDYGVFIEIAPNLAGLAEPDTALRPGQTVSVYIKSILPDKMKIKLVVVNKNLNQKMRFEPHYFVTREAMEAALLQEELVNYFEFVGALNDLVTQGLAIEGANGYTITEKGTTVAQTLSEDLPRSVRESAILAVIRIQSWVHKAAQNHADIEKDGDRYRVTCTIQDKSQQHGAFTLQVTMPDAMTAEQVRDHFVACGSEIYNKVLNLLTQPLSDEQRPPEGVR